MRIITFFVLALACFFGGSLKAVEPEKTSPSKKPVQKISPDGFISLFNGRDLTGWDGKPGCWTVTEGAIQSTGQGKARNWLILRDHQPGDFELHLKFRYTKGNSGVQIRSKDIGNWQVRGYQVEVSESKGMGLWHHSLMSREIPGQLNRKHLATAGQKVWISEDGKKKTEQFAAPANIQAAYHEHGWNDLVIIARGSHLVQKINGVIFSELTDDDKEFSSCCGVIAFQDHGKGAIAAFKDIRLKLLSP